MGSDALDVRGWRLGCLTGMAVATALLFAMPVLWMLASSLRPAEEIFRHASPLQLQTFLPEELTIENYVALVDSPFSRALINSIIVTSITVGVGLLITSLAAFALAAMDMRYSGLIFAIVVIAFLVPFDAVAVPLSAEFRNAHLTNTYVGLVLPGLGNGLAVFIMRQFFMGIPRELRDAALADGANWWTIYWRIYMPMSKPALISAGLILFIFQWHAYLWPLLVTSVRTMDVAPVALARLFGEYGVDFGRLFAGSVVVGLVPAIVLLVLQRHFVTSISSTGLRE